MQAGTYRYPPMERVIYGRPFAAALAEEAARLGARAVFLMASGTLARETDLLRRAEAALGGRLAGVWTHMGAHSPRPDVVAAANAARAARADLIATLGGGSVTDGAKMVGLCLGNGVTEPAQLDAFAARLGPDGTPIRPPAEPAPLPIVAIPTTLSAGEFSALAGCTDPSRQVKQSFAHPTMMPRVVILDPEATVHTPEWLFLSSGIRAVDHAVEDLCSPDAQPLSDAAALHALRLLARGLPAVRANPADLAARLDCQLGAWLSMAGAQAGVRKGASHGIGHVLGGTAGVPHGYTSCVMLPHVLRFNAPVNAPRQALVSEALGRPGMAAGDAVAELIAGLGLPRRLRDLGVPAALLDRIAAESMHDRYIPANPRPIASAAVVRHLLDLAW
ncbi:iron-containing alcohol dehydrogenase [Caldovatus aquaticus]|uniref:Iron-containing alcohol dehydrogenase n=1 Tax=Caldovatus aquaticus TaxID=2865671 RepID=A0ABS7EYE8_9PROT|nr:iron-containing alcohol dehydrogenase [Caldovatus aquaticus]MBW8268380.1 iron-containing alcohol dehydrogenase [Caldovatus aquaticus]